MGRKNQRKIVKEIKHGGKAGGGIKEKRSERNTHRKKETEKHKEIYEKKKERERGEIKRARNK